MTQVEKTIEVTEGFVAFPKIPRLNRMITVTEKLDGTNACVCIGEDGKLKHVQSRSKIITPGKQSDNYGFAQYVQDNLEMFEALGHGYHYGEWWGNGIQRGYGLSEKRFSLFNSARWREDNPPPKGIYVVPVLFSGNMSTMSVDEVVEILRERGSQAAPGFMQPEGVIVYHSASREYYKVLLENDEGHKGNE